MRLPSESAPTLRIIDVTTPDGEFVQPAWLPRAERVHRQLRPQLPADYAAKMRSVFAGGGRLCIAVMGDEVVGVGVYRVYENTFDGVHMYVDDLVSDEARRSLGIGKALLGHMQKVAERGRCVSLRLDSGTQRQRAHRFYFREGMVVSSFHFDKRLTAAAP
jgi:GNAT superfamily N-acetyltransferase